MNSLTEDEDDDELMSNRCLPKDVPGCLELHPHLSDHAEKTSEESKLDLPIDKNMTPPETIVPTAYSDNKAMNSTEKISQQRKKHKRETDLQPNWSKMKPK